MGGELKPCPFCGSKRAVLTFVEGGGGLPAEAWITCDAISCGARGRSFQTAQIYETDGIKSQAIAAWNTRSTPAAPQVDAGELREKVARAAEIRGLVEHANATAPVYAGDVRLYKRAYSQWYYDTADARDRIWEALPEILSLLPSPIEGRREVIEECKDVEIVSRALYGARKYFATKPRHQEYDELDTVSKLLIADHARDFLDILRSLSPSPESPDLATQAATLESELERVREDILTQAEAEARGLV